jgi:hypothetical protein
MSLLLLNVYMPCTPYKKQLCWNSLVNLLEGLQGSNLIAAGDFNTILCNKEKTGGNLVRDPNRELMDDFISHWDLMDFKPNKGKFTWSNKRSGPAHIAA